MSETIKHIEIKSVVKSYGKIHAVNNVDLNVLAGECVALVGPNGAGKSTLFKLILGLVRPTSGTISILGQQPDQPVFDRIRKSIGFLPEQVLFQGSLTGRETLQFYTSLKGESKDQIDGLFQTVELVEAADRRVSTYSKGMRQRLGLAQALIGNPEILLLDEPTSGLDPASRLNFYEIIEKRRVQGAAVLLSSHALTELEARTNRVAVLAHGKLVANGSINALKSKLALSSKIKLKATPTQMKLLSTKFADHFDINHIVNGVAVLDCPENQKVSLVKDLMSSDIKFDGIEIIEPTLEQVFASLTKGEKRL